MKTILFWRKLARPEDICFFLLLFFTEGLLDRLFPKGFDFEAVNLDVSPMTTLLLTLAGLASLPAFFTRPPQIERGEFSATLRLLGTVYLGIVTFVFLLVAEINAGRHLLAEEHWQDSSVGIVFAIVAFCILILTVMLAVRNQLKEEKLKTLNIRVRYFLLIPAMFILGEIVSDLVKLSFDAVSEVSTISDWLLLIGIVLGSYWALYVGPRLFATGEALQNNDWLVWLARFVILMLVSYF